MVGLTVLYMSGAYSIRSTFRYVLLADVGPWCIKAHVMDVVHGPGDVFTYAFKFTSDPVTPSPEGRFGVWAALWRSCKGGMPSCPNERRVFKMACIDHATFMDMLTGAHRDFSQFLPFDMMNVSDVLDVALEQGCNVCFSSACEEHRADDDLGSCALAARIQDGVKAIRARLQRDGGGVRNGRRRPASVAVRGGGVNKHRRRSSRGNNNNTGRESDLEAAMKSLRI